MNRAELTDLLAGFAELSDDCSVQFHFVNLTADRGLPRIVVIRIRVRAVEILMGARADADGPGSADVVVDLEQLQIAIEDLNASVLTIRDVDVALGVGRDRMRDVELVR